MPKHAGLNLYVNMAWAGASHLHAVESRDDKVPASPRDPWFLHSSMVCFDAVAVPFEISNNVTTEEVDAGRGEFGDLVDLEIANVLVVRVKLWST